MTIIKIEHPLEKTQTVKYLVSLSTGSWTEKIPILSTSRDQSSFQGLFAAPSPRLGF